MKRFLKTIKKVLVILLILLLLTAALPYRKDRVLAVLGLAPPEPTVLTQLHLVPAGSIPNMGLPIPPYEGEAVTVMAENQPGFGPEYPVFERCYTDYSELDPLGRAGAAMACIGLESMPTVERGSIGDLRPSGWHNVRSDDLIEDHFLYNRCHILGYQLSGDNGDLHNLFTGTRYLNVEGMLPYENEVASWLRSMGGHVLYRATPRYEGRELVARGIELEAWSVEDHGRGVCFHVFVHNVQPGIVIDYATGESRRA